jgi:methionyl-tRNA formyltransferase
MSVEKSKKLRIAFMGTPDFSVGALQRLIDSEHDVVCVYSQPPRPKGRGQKVQKSPIQLCAENAGIEIRYPVDFKDQKDVQEFDDLDLDIAVVAAYGLILPLNILDAPKYGCINIHASLLPRWRGAAPIQRAIMAGDEKSGVTIMQMEKGLDTGPEILKETLDITSETTAQSLHDGLSALGADMIIDVINMLSQKSELRSVAQSEEGVTYAHMLEKSEGKIDWNKSAIEIDRQIRALNPWPGTWCETQAGKRMKILKATLLDVEQNGRAGEIIDGGIIVCGDENALQLVSVQPENKKPMDVKAALNGGYLKVGDILS